MIASGSVRTDSIWSAAKTREHAESFARKAARVVPGGKNLSGKTPVLFEIVDSRGVPLDQVPGSNTFDEIAIPTGERMQVVDSFRNPDGVLVVKLRGGKPTLDDLATAAKPEVALKVEERDAFRNALKGTAEPTNSVKQRIKTDVAEEAGVGRELGLIQKLRDRQDYRKLLGSAFSGISVGPGRIGNKFLSSNQMLRGVPFLKALSGGLPPKAGQVSMEASDQLVDLVDRAIAGHGSWKGRGERIMDEMVPDLPGGNLFHLRGGQASRPVGALLGKETDPGPDLTDEERQVAMAVIKNLVAMQGAQKKAQ
jgi:hypothetical protein